MSLKPFTWLVDKILQAIDARTRVEVLVHEAFFTDDPAGTPFYFIKVINRSPETDITITHIWVKDGSKEIDILNQATLLPRKLMKTDVWETWFNKKLIHDHDNIFDNVFVLLTNGKKYKSKKDTSVRPKGFVAK